jgi:histidinol-phosphatase (PHP family)
MIASYHNHTTWSDGTTSIDAMVAGARRLGLDVLGLSDHLVLHPSGSVLEWSMDPSRLDEYVRAVRAADGAGPAIRLGLEVDWFPERGDAIRAVLAGHEFDYLIGAVHELDGFPIDMTAEPWEALDEDARNERHRLYWRRMQAMAESGLFDIAAHIDLPKKFGHRATVNLDAEIDAALDAMASADMVVELNTAGWHKPCAEAYPAPDILRRVRARGMPVTLSADAHAPEHLLRDFDRGAALLRDVGFTRIARFERRHRTFDAL